MTRFLPLARGWERVEIARQDSDTSLFMYLMYLGEMMMKIVGLGLVATIADDSDRHRYRQLCKLARADGLGEWAGSIDEALKGPASQHLVEQGRQEQKDLTQKLQSGSWQYDAVALLDQCLRKLDSGRPGTQFKQDGRRWFALFAELRNRTRGHGAMSASTCSSICQDLELSLRLLSDNYCGFGRQWAYIHQNLSGKYRITALSEVADKFDCLKGSRYAGTWGNLCDGVYTFLDRPYLVEMFMSDSEASDFLLPNGAFSGKKFDFISYLTDTVRLGDASGYLRPASDLPGSETQGVGTLNVIGKTFGNVPPRPLGYICRDSLEAELSKRLGDDRHPVVTLVGRGGIGKTSLALSVVHNIAKAEHFGAIFWFSARDVDLLPDGPKLVKPHLLTDTDIAQEFVRLMDPDEARAKDFRSTSYFSQALGKSPLRTPLLFVFDNFETVRNPVELYSWIDTYIRTPNKVLVTTRFRDFKGDYPVEVQGMSEEESDKLIALTAQELGISHLLTQSYIAELYRESDGHPYVIKVLLGDVAKAGRAVKIERLIAGKDEILDALFERTYVGLSSPARQIFLTLCNWRSTVPQVALEAVTLRASNERLDVEEAIEELRRSSLVEVTQSEEDRAVFLSVPLAAAVFGKRKLSVSPVKAAIEANTQLLLYFGAGQKADIRHGLGPRIERFFRHVAKLVSAQPDSLREYLPMLEFIGQQHPRAWLLLASIYEEFGTREGIERAKECLRRYLELEKSPSEKLAVWDRLAAACKQTQDWAAEVHALVEMCSLPDVVFEIVSSNINRFNNAFRQQSLNIAFASDEKQILGKKLLEIAQAKISEADATDLSRMAWLAIVVHDEVNAERFTCMGLEKDPGNQHCLNLAEKLRIDHGLWD